MTDPAPTGLSAVVLAAGESRRMGAVNKLLLPFRGVPLIRRTVETVLAAGFADVIVVLGHEKDRVVEALDGLLIRTVENPGYREGQATSVRAGVAAAQSQEGVMVCLGDQPKLTADDLRTIARAFYASAQPIVVPTYQGTRGNPLVLSKGSVETILAGGRSFGCRQLIQRHRERIETCEMATDHVIRDVDRPEDYAAFEGGSLSQDTVSQNRLEPDP